MGGRGRKVVVEWVRCRLSELRAQLVRCWWSRESGCGVRYMQQATWEVGEQRNLPGNSGRVLGHMGSQRKLDEGEKIAHIRRSVAELWCMILVRKKVRCFGGVQLHDIKQCVYSFN